MQRASFVPRFSDISAINDEDNSPDFIETTSPLSPTKEDKIEETRERSESGLDGEEGAVSWTHWFKVPAFYVYGIVYMGVRMLVNVQSVTY